MIDCWLAALIRETWRAGHSTMCCCENIGGVSESGVSLAGWSMIVFPSHEDALGFVADVVKFERGGDAQYNRITHEGIRSVRGWQNRWHYRVGMTDLAYDRDRDLHAGEPLVRFRVTIYFPAADVPRLVTRMRRAAQMRSRLSEEHVEACRGS